MSRYAVVDIETTGISAAHNHRSFRSAAMKRMNWPRWLNRLVYHGRMPLRSIGCT